MCIGRYTVIRIMLLVVLGAAPHTWAAPDSSDTGEAPKRLYRDPFWPIDYIPESERVVEEVIEEVDPEEEKAELAAQQEKARIVGLERHRQLASLLSIDGFVRGGRDLLVYINGRIVGAGDVLQVAYKGDDYRFTVLSVTDTEISLEPIEMHKTGNETEERGTPNE